MIVPDPLPRKWSKKDIPVDQQQQYKILVVRWTDNSVVTLVSNCQSVHLVGTSKRSEKEMFDIPEPSLVKSYNKNMGGIDRMDCQKVHPIHVHCPIYGANIILRFSYE